MPQLLPHCRRRPLLPPPRCTAAPPAQRDPARQPAPSTTASSSARITARRPDGPAQRLHGVAAPRRCRLEKSGASQRSVDRDLGHLSLEKQRRVCPSMTGAHRAAHARRGADGIGRPGAIHDAPGQDGRGPVGRGAKVDATDSRRNSTSVPPAGNVRAIMTLIRRCDAARLADRSVTAHFEL